MTVELTPIRGDEYALHWESPGGHRLANVRVRRDALTELADKLAPLASHAHDQVLLRDMVIAANRMRDGWAEGDAQVKQRLWQNLHAAAEAAEDRVYPLDLDGDGMADLTDALAAAREHATAKHSDSPLEPDETLWPLDRIRSTLWDGRSDGMPAVPECFTCDTATAALVLAVVGLLHQAAPSAGTDYQVDAAVLLAAGGATGDRGPDGLPLWLLADLHRVVRSSLGSEL